jgi:ATP-dependent DNA helicase RecQ
MEKHLKSTYGFNTFREYQKEIICDLLNNEDVFAILPTGGGKSLLYQFPATYTTKITIVISPLISLMNDQCQYLNSKNIKSVCLNSETRVDVTEYKNYKIIYTTPEFITSRTKLFERVIENIGLFAVDEAHCVSQWSHDFRESYQELGIIKKKFPHIPLLAVTATATPRVLDEMYDFLNITEACEYSLGTRRTNLEISVRPKGEFTDCVFDVPTIVYVQTRKICEKICSDLKEKGITTACYHGGMDQHEKERSHQLFIKGEVMVIVATISFGMGIDKSDIRHVVNYGVPSDIESYYQEIGRAGRDGVNSKATIYYNSQDFATVAHLINNTFEEQQKQIKTDAMKKLRSYLGENNLCRQQMIDYYFETGEFSTEDKITHIPKCNMCDNCCGIKKQDAKNLSEEAKVVVRVIQQNRNNTGFNVGMEKTITLVKQDNDNVFQGKSKKWIRDVIDILATKDIVERRAVGTYGAIVIGIGKVKLRDCLPVVARIDEDVTTKSKYFTNVESDMSKVTKVRDEMANRYGLIPTMFMNDRVLMNVVDNKPKNISELWNVDGISDDFIMCYGNDFIKGLLDNSSKKKNKGERNFHDKVNTSFTHLSNDNAAILYENLKNYRSILSKENGLPPYCIFHNSSIDELIRICPENEDELMNVKGFGKMKIEKYGKEIIHMCVQAHNMQGNNMKQINNKMKSNAKMEILSCYNEGKTIDEIAECRKIKKETVENNLLSIMETEDIDIDPDYFGLSQDYEDEIKQAIKRLGSKHLKPIKDIVNPDISYTQIRLCFLIIRIENEN